MPRHGVQRISRFVPATPARTAGRRRRAARRPARRAGAGSRPRPRTPTLPPSRRRPKVRRGAPDPPWHPAPHRCPGARSAAATIPMRPCVRTLALCEPMSRLSSGFVPSRAPHRQRHPLQRTPRTLRHRAPRSAHGGSPPPATPETRGFQTPRDRRRPGAREWSTPPPAPTPPTAPAPRSRGTRSPCRPPACACAHPSCGPPPSATSGSGSASTSMTGPCSRTPVRVQVQHLVGPASSQRLRPVASTCNRSAEPKQAIREPRNDVIHVAISTSRRDGPSCSREVGSHTFHAVSVCPSQNSRRPFVVLQPARRQVERPAAGEVRSSPIRRRLAGAVCTGDVGYVE